MSSPRGNARSRRVNRRESGGTQTSDDDCSFSSGIRSESDNYLIDMNCTSPAAMNKHNFDFSGIDSGDSDAGGELGILHSSGPPTIPSNGEFNFESELNNILHPPTNNDPRTNPMNHYFDHPPPQQQRHDGNGKGKKSFNLRQQLAIRTQAWTIMLRKVAPSPKDCMIVCLLVVVIIMMLSNGDHPLFEFKSSSMLRHGGRSTRGSESSDTSAEGGGLFSMRRSSNNNLPDRYNNLADLEDPFVSGRETPFFWHVPRSSGVTLQDILSHCWGLVEASQIGATGGHDQEDTLDVWTHADGGKYVNVDTTTPAGILRAKERHLVESGMADVIYSSYMYEASDLFPYSKKGRCFTLLRHPIERAVSTYYFIQDSVKNGIMDLHLWHPSIEDYAMSAHIENNWMTRYLSNRVEGPMQPEYLETAKEVLRTKCVVGLTSKFGESLERFETYFGWKQMDVDLTKKVECQERLVEVGDNQHAHPPVIKDSNAWKLLQHQNSYDLQLYEYALELFESQRTIFG